MGDKPGELFDRGLELGEVSLHGATDDLGSVSNEIAEIMRELESSGKYLPEIDPEDR